MEQRKIGDSALNVSVMGLGTMTFGGGTGKFAKIGAVEQSQTDRLVDIAIYHGVNFFDTSDNYSNGQSERILGKALGKRRDRIVLATKVFGRTGPGKHDIGLSRRHVIDACEASLRRLGTDRIDLYQLHNFDSLVPLEETLRALDDLVAAGKVRTIGCSNFFAWQMVKARGVAALRDWPMIQCQQLLYSLLYRHAEHDLLPAARDQRVGTIVYSPLAQGYLTGKFTTDQPGSRLTSTGQLNGVDTEKARAIVDVLQGVADSHGRMVSPAQIALKWAIDQAGINSVLAGARNAEQLEDNLKAAAITLSSTDREALDRVSRLAPWYPWTAQRVFHPERNPDFARERQNARSSVREQ